MRHHEVNTVDLLRQVRIWRMTALCVGGLAVAGGTVGTAIAQAGAVEAARLRAARPAEIVTIDLPGNAGLSGKDLSIEASTVELEATRHEYTLNGGVKLSWPNGLKVSSETAILRLVHDQATGASRLFIEPKSR